MQERLRKDPAFRAFCERIGDRLRAEREAAGLTQEEAAARIGIAWRHLQRLEKGRANVTVLTLFAASRAFGVEVASFVGDGPDPH